MMQKKMIYITLILLIFSVKSFVFSIEINPTPSLLLKLLPDQKWPTLQSSEIGLLVESHILGVPLALWTPNAFEYDPNKNSSELENELDPAVYYFFQQTNSPRMVYFQSNGEGIGFIKNWKVRENLNLDIAQFSSKNHAHAMAFDKKAHLVKLEINDGAGAGEQLDFVATDVSILDPSPQDKDLATFIEKFLRPFSDKKSEANQELNALLLNALEKIEKDTSLPSEYIRTTYPSHFFYPEVDFENKTLKVTYYRNWTSIFSKHMAANPRKLSQKFHVFIQPKDVPFSNQEPAENFYFGAEVATTAVYNFEGILLQQEVHPVSLFKFSLTY